jgi:hypothetical protein
VQEAAQSSAQIVASAGQQALGMEQIRHAVGNIQQATQQNLTASRQSEQRHRISLGSAIGCLRSLARPTERNGRVTASGPMNELGARLRAMFVEELEDQVSVANTHLLALERMPDDAEELRSLFRVMHTLKGAARSRTCRSSKSYVIGWRRCLPPRATRSAHSLHQR